MRLTTRWPLTQSSRAAFMAIRAVLAAELGLLHFGRVNTDNMTALPFTMTSVNIAGYSRCGV